jgi:hypothetical protein
LTQRQAQWSLFLATFDYIIIPKLGKYNKADGLSRRPDYKEEIASKNAECILLTPKKFLLKPKQFEIWALSRLGTHYLCGSSEGLNDGLEVEVIDKEEEMGKGKINKAEDDGSEVG